jgi:hypothetical protein
MQGKRGLREPHKMAANIYMSTIQKDPGILSRGHRIVARLTLRFRKALNEKGLRHAPKVFAIGFNKSATTSIHELFKSLGIPSLHQGIGGKGIWRTLDDKKLLQSYDCFSDGVPIVGDVENLNKLFPDAKYILQVRDLEGWVYSRIAHIEKIIKNKPWAIKHPPASAADVKKWILQRNKYHAYVLDYFSTRPDDLVIVNFIRDSGSGSCRKNL